MLQLRTKECLLTIRLALRLLKSVEPDAQDSFGY